MQWNAEVLAYMEGAGQQHAGLRRRQQCLGHAPITLLLHSKHRRQLAVRQQAAVRFTDIGQQTLLHLGCTRALPPRAQGAGDRSA